MGYVLALKPSHAWWHPIRALGSFQEAAQAARWQSAERPGRWVKVTRTFRDGSSQEWWALEVITGPYGPSKQERVVIATTDPITLPAPFHVLSGHQSASARCASGCRQRTGRGQSAGSGATLWVTAVGRTEL